MYVDLADEAWVQTRAGRHRLTHVRYLDGEFHAGHKPDLVGPDRAPRIEWAELSPREAGLTLHLADGYETRIPVHRVQATWRTAPKPGPDLGGITPRNPYLTPERR